MESAKNDGEPTGTERQLFSIIDTLLKTNTKVINTSVQAVELAKMYEDGKGNAQGIYKYCSEIGKSVDIGTHHGAAVTYDNGNDGLRVNLSIDGEIYQAKNPDFTVIKDENGEKVRITYSGINGNRYCFKAVFL